jgi:hypothetical protein
LKTFNGESFEVRREENNSTVVFKGALRLSGTADYAPILEMLKETLITPRHTDFARSSGTGFPQQLGHHHALAACH